MKIKNVLISVISICFMIIGFNVYKMLTKQEEGKKHVLRRKNAMTPEEFENVLSKMNKKLRDD